jgi:NitT/TauT family transport system substrate-binding protein
MKLKRLMQGGLAALLLLAVAGMAEAQVKIRVGTGLVPPHWAPVIFDEPSLATHNGKTYQVELIPFRGSAAQLAALASGDLDIAALAYSTFAGGIINGRQNIVGIADLCRDGPWFSNVFAVRDDSPVKSVADLKGKVVAVNARGGSVDMAVRTLLLRAGLKPDSDVTIVEAGFGAMESVLREGKADLSAFDPALWARASAKGGLRPLFYQRDAQGVEQFLFYAAKRDFIEKNRAALVDWLEDYVRGVQWLLNPANREQALQKLAAKAKGSPESFATWALLEGKDWYHDPQGLMDLKAFQANVDELVEFGILKQKLDIAPHVDESLVREAAARLKK